MQAILIQSITTSKANRIPHENFYLMVNFLWPSFLCLFQKSVKVSLVHGLSHLSILPSTCLTLLIQHHTKVLAKAVMSHSMNSPHFCVFFSNFSSIDSKPRSCLCISISPCCVQNGVQVVFHYTTLLHGFSIVMGISAKNKAYSFYKEINMIIFL